MKVKGTVADMEWDERTWRHDSFEENSTLSGQPEQTDVVTKCRQPLLLHRPPRLGLSRLQKPSGIHDITIIKDISFNGDSEAECESPSSRRNSYNLNLLVSKNSSQK